MTMIQTVKTPCLNRVLTVAYLRLYRFFS